MKKRVLYIIYTLNAGGIETLGVNIFKNLNKERFEVDFLVMKVPEKEQFYDKEILRMGGRIIPVGNCRSNKIIKYFTYEMDIFRTIKNGNYDVVHINSGDVHSLPELMSAKLCGIKNILVHSHNSLLFGSAKFYRIRYALQGIFRKMSPLLANHLLTCSNLAAKWSYSKKAINNKSVIQINNGVHSSEYRFDQSKRANFRKKLELKDELLIGHIGRMNVQKNHHFLLQVFYEIHRINPDAKLILCGIGELENELRAQAETFGLKDSVIFYGVTNEIPAVLSAIDAFVFPSLFEGLPVVGIEAQASGVPVFASDTITPDVAVTPCWHTLSLKDSPKAWAETILELTKQSKRIETGKMIGDAGFDIVNTTKLLEQLYETP
ncbi:glycosyltransferase involved in cell wall biosynthesis [Bacillus sp. SORGH_AS 510]|uniref:glycosyltransferase family 1 protein n=1 Tax=Bacillus sp. SORGH_AS_0510 TaxID=3041771 RepID=UPI002780EE27|nr:glycosyltransferase family 1 protein [Bacillus sp. SORGH_AS_0510]MDQ1143765.1 glycosyltransferase involved in cell wall biosynthesis [Bacillus sp. SORGH_AS_0510]